MTSRCVPVAGGGVACGPGPLTQTDIDAIRDFQRFLQEQYVTEQSTTTEPAEAAPPPPPAPVDITDLAGWVDADKKLTGEIEVLTLRLKELTEARDLVRTKVQVRIGDAHEARINGRPVIRWAPQKPGTYLDQKGLKAAHPDIVAAFQKIKKATRPYVIIEDGT